MIYYHYHSFTQPNALTQGVDGGGNEKKLVGHEFPKKKIRKKLSSFIFILQINCFVQVNL